MEMTRGEVCVVGVFWAPPELRAASAFYYNNVCYLTTAKTQGLSEIQDSEQKYWVCIFKYLSLVVPWEHDHRGELRALQSPPVQESLDLRQPAMRKHAAPVLSFLVLLG